MLATSDRPCVRLVALLLAAGILGGCEKTEASPSQPSPTNPATPSNDSAPDDAERTTAILDRYEKIRALLADDAIVEVAAPAGALARAAKAAIPKASKQTAQPLTDLAKAAADLEKMDKSDADAVRKQFGEVSRAFVALLRAEPALQKGRHLFHCPMAQGFPHWVQPTDDLANPYMGKQMLKCGSKREWKKK